MSAQSPDGAVPPTEVVGDPWAVVVVETPAPGVIVAVVVETLAPVVVGADEDEVEPQAESPSAPSARIARVAVCRFCIRCSSIIFT